MTVGIPPEFVCPQGHRWRLDDHPADRSDDERLRCLICGGDALPADQPIGEGEGPSGQPPRHGSNPPPGRPTFPAIPGYAILGVLGRGRVSLSLCVLFGVCSLGRVAPGITRWSSHRSGRAR